MKKILITGIHGFVGSNLVAELKKEHIIYGLDIIAPTKEGIIKTYGWNELDQIPLVDCIIHLAGKAQDTRNTLSEQAYFETNLGLTQKIFDYFLQSDARKFIFFSSVKAVADTVIGEILTEKHTPNPQTPYGQSKLAAEQYITGAFANWLENNHKTISHSIGYHQADNPKPKTRNFYTERSRSAKPETRNQEPATSKSIYILRPCMIHGPGNKGNLNLLYRNTTVRLKK